MKTRHHAIGSLVAAFMLLLGISAYAQPQFTLIKATKEGAIQLHWQSKSNTLYRIDYANELVDVNNGVMEWKTLYTHYPSHGTNTFIADGGNYDFSPEVPHPKFSPMRFYRLYSLGTNDGVNPTISILSPTNGAVLSGEVLVTVDAGSSENLTEVQLFVDGEEVWPSDNDTNFVINTCEWDNGPHVLFAVAKSASGFVGLPYGPSITRGSAVSAYVNVTFDNLITRWDFSRPFFAPENAETQTVTAVFAANVNWNLEIQDKSSNAVRTATGSGTSMSWDFDGRDQNGQLLTPSLYWYVLTAHTNGQAFFNGSSGGSGGSGGPPVLNSFSSFERLFEDWYPTSPQEAMLAGLTSYFLPSPPHPPVRIDGKWFNWEEVFGPQALREVQISLQTQEKFLAALESFGSVELGPSGAAAASSTASQNTKGPQRKPKQRHIGVKGNFGILYQDYPDGPNCPPPRKLLFPRPYVKLDGQPQGTLLNLSPLPDASDFANAFITGMRNTGYTNKFSKGGGQWSASDLTGNNALINSVNFAIVSAHGSYAEDAENPDGILHTYIWLADGSYARLGDMRLGAGPNALRWATFYTCNTLRSENIASYNNHSMLNLIMDDNLHLLLGAQTIISGNPNTAKYYAENLKNEMTIPNAWYEALRRAIQIAPNKPNGIRTARVLGHQPCFTDKLMDWSYPDQGISSQSVQVYPE